MHTQTQPSYHNTFHPDPLDSRITSICTSPKFAIGQRCILLETSQGNILWDCITYLDQATVDFIASRGGLRGIVISHPHYYTTHLDWARTFDCPVWFSQEDAEEWVSRGDEEGRRRLISKGKGEEDVLGGGEEGKGKGEGVVKAIKVGGHFPGSLVLLWEKKLFVADSLVTTPVRSHNVKNKKTKRFPPPFLEQRLTPPSPPLPSSPPSTTTTAPQAQTPTYSCGRSPT